MNSRACCYSSVIESDSFILFMRGGFHRTWQRFQGETSIFRIPTMSLPLTHSINFWAHYAVNSGNVYSILLSINHRLHTKRSIQDLLFLKGQSVWKKKMCAQSNAFIIFVIMVCKSKLMCMFSLKWCSPCYHDCIIRNIYYLHFDYHSHS